MINLLSILFICLSIFIPQPPHYSRIMFIGNSLTFHAPAPDIGWNGDWGMAASQPDKDYVHRVQLGIAARTGTIPQVSVIFSDLMWMEPTIPQQIAEFQPDLLIVEMGDNTSPALPEQAFVEAYGSILQGTSARVLLTGLWGANDERDSYIHKIADSHHATYVQINDLNTYTNTIASEVACVGVRCGHPGDAGMQAIADRLLGVIFAADTYFPILTNDALK